MRKFQTTLLAAMALCATPVLAHVGPEAMDRHFLEHLLIALAVGLPLAYGVLRLLKRSGDHRR